MVGLAFAYLVFEDFDRLLCIGVGDRGFPFAVQIPSTSFALYT